MTEPSLEWLLKSRSNYWDEPHAGKRYSILRQIKNRYGQFAGKFTQTDVCTRVQGISPGTLRQFEIGRPLAEPFINEILPKLVNDLELTMAQFNTTQKLREGVGPTPEVSTAQPAPTPQPTPVARSTAATPSKESTKSGPMTVVNHTLNTFVVLVKGSELHIMDDTADNLKKAGVVWVAPADDIGGGHKILARSTIITK